MTIEKHKLDYVTKCTLEKSFKCESIGTLFVVYNLYFVGHFDGKILDSKCETDLYS
jgi:hypothetical protein